MGEIYLTSDLHLGHNQPFLYEPRGFDSIEEHDEVIISNINQSVSKDDTLYILGDLMLNDNDRGIEYLKKIKCKNIFVIRGNHDTNNRLALYAELPNFSVLGYAELIKYKKWNFMLSHYPMSTSNLDDEKKPFCRVWNCCGHSHTKEKLDINTNSIHCELDAWNNYPVSLEQIKQYIKDGRNDKVARL